MWTNVNFSLVRKSDDKKSRLSNRHFYFRFNCIFFTKILFTINILPIEKEIITPCPCFLRDGPLFFVGGVGFRGGGGGQLLLQSKKTAEKRNCARGAMGESRAGIQILFSMLKKKTSYILPPPKKHAQSTGEKSCMYPVNYPTHPSLPWKKVMVCPLRPSRRPFCINLININD